MSCPKAQPSLHIAPPPSNSPKPRVQIGSAFSPGSIVRKPAEGIFYEVMPANQGASADKLQACLLADYRPRQVVRPLRYLTDFIVRWIDWLGRVCFNVMTMLGMLR